jgi:hypothetical protein
MIRALRWAMNFTGKIESVLDIQVDWNVYGSAQCVNTNCQSMAFKRKTFYVKFLMRDL